MRIVFLMAGKTIHRRRQESLQSLRSRVAFSAIHCGMFSNQLKSKFTMIEILLPKAVYAIMTVKTGGSIVLDMRLRKCSINLIVTGLANSRVEFCNVSRMTIAANKRFTIDVFLVAV